MSWLGTVVFGGLLFLDNVTALKEYDMSSKEISWTVENCDGNIKVPASVPGIIHTDLMSAGILKENPYFRFNELEQSWVCKDKCWRYSSVFPRPSWLSKDAPLFIELTGVDTVATIKVNDKVVGESDNAFQSYLFEVPVDTLQSSNTIVVEISSPITEAHARAAAYAYSVPATENYNVWAEPSDRNFIRKAGSDFGWDWGPAYAPSGITGQISLFQSPIGKVSSMTVRQSLSADYSQVTLTPRIRVAKVVESTTVDIIVSVNGEMQSSGSYVVEPVSATSDYSALWLDSLDIKNPTLWFPVGFGDPYLYTVDVKVCPSGVTEESSCQSISKRIGVREVVLVRDYIDPSARSTASNSTTRSSSRMAGRSLTIEHTEPLTLYQVPAQNFYFKVNGRKVFARGANFIF
jgi:beta-mannosidase